MDLTISERIKNLRLSHNISQEELAINIGVARQTVTNYENQNSQPDLETLKKIAIFFGVTTDFLLDIDNDDIPQEYIKKLLYYGRKLNATNRDIIIGTMASMLIDQQCISSNEKNIS